MHQESTTTSVTYKDVPGFPGYRVGDDGSVWTCLKVKGLGRPTSGFVSVQTDDWRRKSPVNTTDCYWQVSLRRALPDGKRKQFSRPVHLIVLRAFCGERPEGMVARHLNGDRKDNRLSNLAWGTPEENCRDRDRHGTTARGEKSGNSRLSRTDVERIRMLRGFGVPLAKLGKVFGISKRQVFRIVHGLSWAHQGEVEGGAA